MATTLTRDTVGGRPVDPAAPLLAVEDLHVEFRIDAGTVRAVNGLSYVLGEGETVAIVGESGTGKTVSAQAVMGIVDRRRGSSPGGRCGFAGWSCWICPRGSGAGCGGNRIAMIFQDALTALNPVFSVGWQIGEMFRHPSGGVARGRRRRRRSS